MLKNIFVKDMVNSVLVTVKIILSESSGLIGVLFHAKNFFVN